MRTPKEKMDVDLTKPINKDAMQKDDPCFGSLWDPTNNSCAICHSIEVCGILYQEKIKKKKTSFEKEKGPTLDMAKFNSVDFERIARNIEAYSKKDIDITIDDLITTIAQAATIKDKTTILEYIKRQLPLYNLTIENNVIVSYEKGSDNFQAPGQLTK